MLGRRSSGGDGHRWRPRSWPGWPSCASVLVPGDDALVFGDPLSGEVLGRTQLRRRYHRALKAAGLPPLRFHDLRHTFGTVLAAAGEPMTTIQGWMGHADLKTTQIYAHFAPGADAAARIAAAFQTTPAPALTVVGRMPEADRLPEGVTAPTFAVPGAHPGA